MARLGGVHIAALVGFKAGLAGIRPDRWDLLGADWLWQGLRVNYCAPRA